MVRFNFTKRQWATLLVMSLADFCNAICVSLQAPFFPKEVSTSQIANFCIKLTVFNSCGVPGNLKKLPQKTQIHDHLKLKPNLD